jgi:transcriptional regulator with XRE-family HTH domain
MSNYWKYIIAGNGDPEQLTVRYVMDRLRMTYREIAHVVGAHPRSVARWAKGEGRPQTLKRQTLLELACVAEAVAEVLPDKSPDQAWAFVFQPIWIRNGYSRPVDLLRDGDYREVLDYIHRLNAIDAELADEAGVSVSTVAETDES